MLHRRQLKRTDIGVESSLVARANVRALSDRSVGKAPPFGKATATTMKVVTREEGVGVVLEPKSSLVGRATDDLSEAFRRVLESERFDVTIDLKMVSMVDGSGLEALLSCTEKCASLGGKCVLLNATDKVKIVLHVTRLERELDLAAAT